MKTLFTILTAMLFMSNNSFGQSLKKERQAPVFHFIKLIKSNDKVAMSRLVSYPLERKYPIPNIKNAQEFADKYDELFDEHLKTEMIKSKPAIDWTEVGYRGLMFKQGEIWLDQDGRLIAINYQSAQEKNIRDKLIQAEKQSLHPSVQNYLSPIYLLETTQFKIRIDELNDGSFRYASWNIKQAMSNKPNLIINQGLRIPEGSGGNMKYQFKNGDYIYDCDITVIGEEDVPFAELTISKNDDEILTEKAQIARH